MTLGQKIKELYDKLLALHTEQDLYRLEREERKQALVKAEADLKAYKAEHYEPQLVAWNQIETQGRRIHNDLGYAEDAFRRASKKTGSWNV